MGRDFVDGQIFETNRMMKAPGVDSRSRRVVYQYRSSRAKRDLRTLAEQQERAKKVVDGGVSRKVKYVKRSKHTTRFDQSLYDRHVRLAGIKGYVTNLSKRQMSGAQIIESYHDLWQVERSFRMFKGDLKARPMWHHTSDAIRAHLVIVFTALAVSRHLEAITGMTLKAFLRAVKPLRDAQIKIDGHVITAKTQIPEPIQAILTTAGLAGH